MERGGERPRHAGLHENVPLYAATEFKCRVRAQPETKFVCRPFVTLTSDKGGTYGLRLPFRFQ